MSLPSIREQFDSIVEMDAHLTVNDIDLGPCRARLTYNPYELNNMEVELFDPPELSIPNLPQNPKFSDLEALDARLVEGDEVFNRSVHLRSTYLTLHPFSSSFTIPVTEYRYAQMFDPQTDCTRIRVLYKFPLTTVARTRSSKTMDARHGLYHGTLDQSEMSVKLEKDSLVLKADSGDIEISELYEMHDVERGLLYPVIILVKQSGCAFTLECHNNDLSEAVERARVQAETILRLFSLVEQNRINWNVEEVNLLSAEGKWIGLTRTYRWTSPPSDKYRPDHSTMRKARECLGAVYNAFKSLSAQEKKLVERGIENFELANCAGVLETKLVFWHSCLDHIMQEMYGNKQGPFSKRLVRVCDAVGVEMSDLFENEVIDYWHGNTSSSSRCFWFVDARNRFIHKGLVDLLNESYRIIDAVRNARALAERLLLAKMGLNHKDVCLGSPSLR